MARIDLRKSVERIGRMLEQRIKDYPHYVNAGPGKDEDDIHLVTLGFQFDQAGWVALVFDTRPKAKLDGEWQSFIEENAEPFDAWAKAFKALLENGSKLSLTLPDGTTQSFTADADMEAIAECFGLACRHALEDAKERGVFKSLPLAKGWRLAVEEHEGHYGWLEGEVAKGPTEAEIKQALQQAAEKLSDEQKIAYWISLLESVAAGKPWKAGRVIGDTEFVLKQLKPLAKQAVLPLLKWACGWADKPEFKSAAEVSEDDSKDRPHSNVVCQVFMTLGTWRWKLPDAESLLQQYVRTAVKLKPVPSRPAFTRSKKLVDLYGISPCHAAWLLHSHFEGYPEPVIDGRSNKLRNADLFVG